MIVVADTSVLINLCRIQRVELLRELFREVFIPPVVAAEFSPWLDVTPGLAISRSRPGCRSVLRKKSFPSFLSLAIALALEIQADAILIDDRQGHAAAARVGLVVIGLLGVLLQARMAGLIPAIGPALKALREDAGFWISDSLHREILRLAGEKS